MYNLKTLFTAILLTATATTAWAKAEAVLFANSDCSGADHSGTIGMSTGVCHSTYITNGTGGYANSVHFYTDGVAELYYCYPEENCGGSDWSVSHAASVCLRVSGFKSFKKAL